jgi:hypothetical protein
MARITVGPKAGGGGWQVSGDNQAYKTQAKRSSPPAGSSRHRVAASWW